MTIKERENYLNIHTNLTPVECKRHAESSAWYSDNIEGLMDYVVELNNSGIDSSEAYECWKKLETVGDYKVDFFL